MLEVLKSAIIDISVAAVWAIFTIGTAYLTSLVKSWSKEAKEKIVGVEDENKRNLLTEAFNRAEYLAEVTVKAIEQTTAGYLREQVKNKIADRNALLELGKKAVEEIYNQLAPKYIEAINEGTGSINTYLTNLVEKKVLQLKS